MKQAASGPARRRRAAAGAVRSAAGNAAAARHSAADAAAAAPAAAAAAPKPGRQVALRRWWVQPMKLAISTSQSKVPSPWRWRPLSWLAEPRLTWCPSTSGRGISWRNWSRRYARLIGIEASAAALDTALAERRALLTRHAYLSSQDVPRPAATRNSAPGRFLPRPDSRSPAPRCCRPRWWTDSTGSRSSCEWTGTCPRSRAHWSCFLARRRRCSSKSSTCRRRACRKGRRAAAALPAGQPVRLEGAPMKRNTTACWRAWTCCWCACWPGCGSTRRADWRGIHWQPPARHQAGVGRFVRGRDRPGRRRRGALHGDTGPSRFLAHAPPASAAQDRWRARRRSRSMRSIFTACSAVRRAAA